MEYNKMEYNKREKSVEEKVAELMGEGNVLEAQRVYFKDINKKREKLIRL